MSGRFPIQVMTSDVAVLHCLRGLAFYSETSNKQGTVAGVSNERWLANGEVVTFHFSTEDARDEFQHQVDRLLPENMVVLQVLSSANDVAV